MPLLKSKVNSKKGLWFFYLFLFAAALFLRLYKLTEQPFGIYVDEAGSLYDAWCLANYGTDRYLNYLPVYLINFGGGQSALYAYIVSIFGRFVGFNLWASRLPMVLFSMLTLVFGTLLVRRSLGERSGMVCCFLLAICPVFILQSRFGLDCNLMLGTCTAALYFLVLAVEKQQKRWFFVCGVTFGIALYTYALSYITIPLFLALALCLLLRAKKLRISQFLCTALPVGICAVPLLLFIVINRYDIPAIVTPFFTVPRLPAYRGGEIKLQSIPGNIAQLFMCYFFLDKLDYDALAPYYTLYLPSIPFALYGIGLGAKQLWCDVKEKAVSTTAFIFCFFVAQSIMGLLIRWPSIYRVNGIYFSLVFFVVLGMRRTWQKMQNARAKNVVLAVFLCVYIGSLGCFMHSYFSYRQNEPMTFFNASFEEPLAVLRANSYEGAIYFDDYVDDENLQQQPYIYYLLAEKLSPYDAALTQADTVPSIQNATFSLPDTITPNNAYLVRSNHEEAVLACKELGDAMGCVPYAQYYLFYPATNGEQGGV